MRADARTVAILFLAFRHVQIFITIWKLLLTPVSWDYAVNQTVGGGFESSHVTWGTLPEQ